MSDKENKWLSRDLRHFDVVGEPNHLGSFVELQVVKNNAPSIVYRSKENLIGNDSLVQKILKVAEKLGPIVGSEYVVDVDVSAPLDGEPNLYVRETPGRGNTLDQVMVKEPRLSWEVSSKYIDNILVALSSFHNMNLVYGALDPHFIHLVADQDKGGKKAKLGGTFHIHNEGDDFAVGYNPEFICPDLQDREIASDKTKDIYSVGMIAYRLLLGEEQYATCFESGVNATGSAAREVAWGQIHAQKYESESSFADPAGMDTSIPPPIAHFVTRLLNAANKELRFADALEARTGLQVAIQQAATWSFQQKKINEEGMKPIVSPITTNSKVSGGESGGNWINIAAAVVVVCSIVAGGAYYQFVKVPRDNATAALNSEIRTATLEREATWAAFKARRDELKKEVSNLAQANPLRDQVATIEGEVLLFTSNKGLDTPAQIRASRDGIQKITDKFDTVSGNLSKLKSQAQVALGSLQNELNDLKSVSREDDQSVIDLVGEQALLTQKYNDASFDSAASGANELSQLVLRETEIKQSKKTTSEEIYAKLQTQLNEFRGIASKQAFENFGAASVLKDIKDEIEEQRFDSASEKAEGILNQLTVQVNSVKVLRNNANAAVQEAAASIAAISEQIENLSAKDQFTGRVGEQRQSLAQAVDSLKLNEYRPTIAVSKGIVQATKLLEDDVLKLAQSAQDKLLIIEDLNTRYSKLSMNGVELPSEIRIEEKRAASYLEKGDSSSSVAAAERAISGLKAIVEDLKRKRDEVRQAVRSAQSGMDELVNSGAERFDSYEKVRKLLNSITENFETRDFPNALLLLARFESESALLSSDVKKADLKYTQLNASIQAGLVMLRKKGTGPEALTGILRTVEDAQSARSEQKILQALTILQGVLDAISTLNEKIDGEEKDFAERLAAYSSVFSSYSELKYKQQIVVQGGERLIEEAKSKFAEFERIEASRILSSALPSLEANYLKMASVSEMLVKNIQSAETGRKLADESNLSSSDDYKVGQEKFQLAQDAVVQEDFQTAIAQSAEAGGLFEKTIAASIEQKQRLSNLTTKIEAGLEEAMNRKAMSKEAHKTVSEQFNIQVALDVSKRDPSILTELLEEVEGSLATLEAEKPKAEAVKKVYDDVILAISEFPSHLEKPVWAKIQSDGNAANDLFNKGVYIDAILAYEAAHPDAEKFLSELNRPPAMRCDVEGGLEGLVHVNGGDHQVGPSFQNVLFQRRYLNKFPLNDPVVSLQTQFCIQPQYLTYDEFIIFLNDADAASRDRITSEIKIPKNSAEPIKGLQKADAQQYVKWLSVKTGRTYRLPTGHELLVSDSLDLDEDEVNRPRGFTWVSENCSTFMALVTKIDPKIVRSEAECRLSNSLANDDIGLRLILEPSSEDGQRAVNKTKIESGNNSVPPNSNSKNVDGPSSEGETLELKAVPQD